MALHTTADILLNSTLEKVSQGLSPKLWINNTGTTSYSSLKTASQKQPSNFNVSIPIQYDTTYVINVADNAGIGYYSAAELFAKLDDAIQDMVDGMASTYTVTISNWSAEILDYKVQQNSIYNGTAIIYNLALIAQINLYVA